MNLTQLVVGEAPLRPNDKGEGVGPRKAGELVVEKAGGKVGQILLIKFLF